MNILCSNCHKYYEEIDKEQISYFEDGHQMVCFECLKKYYQDEGWKFTDDVMVKEFE